MLWLSLLAFIWGVLVYYIIYRPRQYFKANGIKYLKSVPIFGEMWPIVIKRMSLFENLQRIYKKTGDAGYYGHFIFVTPTLMIKDPELVKLICIKYFENFMDHTNLISPEVDTILGNSMLALQGQKWKKVRTILSPAFTGSKMKAMFHFMQKCSEEFHEYLTLECQDEEITKIDVKEAFTKITNNVISSCAFGLESNSFKEPDNEFYVISKAITDLRGLRGLSLFLASLSLTLMKILKLSFLRPHESIFFRKIFTETVKYREESKIVRPDMIHLLMQAKQGQLRDEEMETAEERVQTDRSKDLTLNVDDDAIVAQAVTFLAAGFATTSTVLVFASHILATHSDVQDKLIKEIDDIYYKSKSKITYEVLVEMKYLDMIISETIRLYPPIPMTDRHCTKDFIFEDKDGKKIEIKKGFQINIPIAAIHRDERHFQNADTFDPERFSDDRKHLIKSGSYIPFGLGPRICIGNRFAILEVKLVLVNLLLKYELVVVNETEIPVRIDKSSIAVIPENPIYLGFKKRSKIY